MKCRVCGQENPENMTFCVNCGNNLTGIKPQNFIKDNPVSFEKEQEIVKENNIVQNNIQGEPEYENRATYGLHDEINLKKKSKKGILIFFVIALLVAIVSLLVFVNGEINEDNSQDDDVIVFNIINEYFTACYEENIDEDLFWEVCMPDSVEKDMKKILGDEIDDIMLKYQSISFRDIDTMEELEAGEVENLEESLHSMIEFYKKRFADESDFKFDKIKLKKAYFVEADCEGIYTEYSEDEYEFDGYEFVVAKTDDNDWFIVQSEPMDSERIN